MEKRMSILSAKNDVLTKLKDDISDELLKRIKDKEVYKVLLKKLVIEVISRLLLKKSNRLQGLIALVAKEVTVNAQRKTSNN